ncbi:Rieske 2Fe-2S domain-containing protein [Draconibacterium orientale]|uniref:Rieske (2Fe-2S) protein n=1 Tax=Draconibacterium orientale TaxID=1168034 RepID=UPI002ABE383B|nr:Rieske 2Fe-2S domain-containing protein [Draconibacterium orientale]
MQKSNTGSKAIYSGMKYLFFIVLTFLMYSSCNEIDSEIPDVWVGLNLDLGLYNELTVPGNSAYFPNQGFGGVIVYCEIEGSYYAFDAACTNEINPSCRVVNDGAVGKCSCCESEYIFIGGTVLKGPAAAPLKQYNTSLSGNILRVYN